MSGVKNKFEARIAAQFRKAKVKFKYESDRIPYILHGTYIPDFVLNLPSGSILYIEAKGYLRPEHKRKMVAVRKQHPDKDVRILFYRYNKQYIKWAEKHGFIWAIERVPKEWIDGR